jgi:hypothetical protein
LADIFRLGAFVRNSNPFKGRHIKYYNEKREHSSLDKRTPAEVFREGARLHWAVLSQETGQTDSTLILVAGGLKLGGSSIE